MLNKSMKKIKRYEIREEIGRGGMGVVYKAYDPDLDRIVAIKVISEKALEFTETKERFYREARSAGKLSHANITIVHEIGEIFGTPYIVMEYLQGLDLRSILDRKEPLTIHETLDFAKQICRALEFAHSHSVIHRDIKPENIKILPDGKVKLLDFGIAKILSGETTRAKLGEKIALTTAGMKLGTPWYMSPEQIRGQEIDKRTDVFSFGIVLFELLTYKKPFEGDETTVQYRILEEQPQKISFQDIGFADELQALVSKCLEKNPKDRYSDFSEIIKNLDTIIEKARKKKSVYTLLKESRLFIEQGKYKEGANKIDKALQIDPNHTEAISLKQNLLVREKEFGTLRVLSGKILGETISHYKILEQLGKGSVGVVYKAKDLRSNLKIAIKYFLPELTCDIAVKEQLLKEIQLVSSHEHPNIYKINEFAETEAGQFYMVMPFYDTKTLKQHIASTEQLEISECIDIAMQITKGMAKAHELGLRHGNIKPENFIITGDGTVKILDLGLSKLGRRDSLTIVEPNVASSSLPYVSPEQIRGRELTERSDIWSLGVVFYELLTGKQPFRGEYNAATLYAIESEMPEAITKINPAVPEYVARIVYRALEKKPKARYRDSKEMLKVFEQEHSNFIKQKQQLELIEKLFVDIVERLQEKDFAEAVRLYKQILEIDAENETALVGLQQAEQALALQTEIAGLLKDGKSCFGDKNYQEALSKFQAVVKLDPENQEAAPLIAECENLLKQTKKISQHLNAGKTLFEKGKYQQALEHFNRVIGIDPENTDAKKYIANIQKAVEQAEHLKNLFADARSNLQKENFKKAIVIYEEILKVDPTNKDALRDLEKAQKGLEKLQKRLERATIVVSDSPKQKTKTLSKYLWVGIPTILLVSLIGWFFLSYLGKDSSDPRTGLAEAAESAKQEMLQLKNQAEGIGAPNLAAEIYKEALRLEQEAEDAFTTGNYEAALKDYTQSKEKYQQAIGETNRKKSTENLSLLMESARQVHKTMLEEKSAAEKAGAKNLAARQFSQAERFEKQGDQDMQTGDEAGYQNARNNYEKAADGYKRAREQAEKTANTSPEAEEVKADPVSAKLREAADLAKTEMEKAKNNVSGSASDKATSPVYQRALQYEEDGSRQYDAENYREAEQTFNDAKTSFDDANTDIANRKLESRAQQAKDDMLTEKLKISNADRRGSKYEQAKNAEQKAENTLTGGDVEDAISKFETAKRLYAEVVRDALQKTAAENAKKEIQDKIDLYDREMQAFQELLLSEDKNIWSAFFSNAEIRKYSVVRSSNITFSSDYTTAHVDITISMDFRTPNNDIDERKLKRRLYFKKQGNMFELAQIEIFK